MDVIFLNEGLVKALEPYGIKVNDVETTITDPLDILEYTDTFVVELQTERMLECSCFKDCGFKFPTLTDTVKSVRDDNDLNWDVFLKEGALSYSETLQRLVRLNCVATKKGTLVFFVDESNEVNVIERALHATAQIHSTAEIMKTPLWNKFKKIS